MALALVLMLASAPGWGGPLGAPGSPGPDGEDDLGAAPGAWDWLLAGSNRLDVVGEALIGSDITVLRSTAAYEHQRDKITVGVTLGYTDIDLDYTPGAVTFPASRSEANREAQVDLGWQVNPNFELTALGRGYHGYPDYRAVWIAEYYEQVSPVQLGYREPDPKGWAVGAGAVWDVVPGASRLSFDLGYGEDHVVESWGFPAIIVGVPMLEKGRGRLDTVSGGVTWEQALNGWLKTENSIRAQEITDREPRFLAQSSWAVALGPDWTVRLHAGATRERPNLEAYFGGALVDFEFLPRWHLSGHARYYEDTGDIESSGSSSSAAPGLQSFELGGSLLYDQGDFAIRLSGGFYNTDFEPLDPTNVFFGPLYRDREWWITRLAISYSF